MSWHPWHLEIPVFGTSQVWWIMADHYESLADQIGKVHQSTKETPNISDSICLKKFENRLIYYQNPLVHPHFTLIFPEKLPFDVKHRLLATAVQLHSIEAEDRQCCYVTLIPGALKALGIMIFPFTVHDLGIMII